MILKNFVGNIEGVSFVQKGNLVSLSEEQLVECDTIDHGCDGGKCFQISLTIG